MSLDFSGRSLLRSLFDTFEEGIAVFDSRKTLLYVNAAMQRITGSTPGAEGNSLFALSERHRLRTMNGTPLEPKDFPVFRAFEGEDIRDERYIYMDAHDVPRILRVSCRPLRDEEGALRYVITSISDCTENDATRRKLSFLVEAAKRLSITMDFRDRMIEKARLAVPSLADWCAIDVLQSSGDIERVAVIHEDPRMVDYIFELERRFPPESGSASHRAIRSGEPQFIPIVTDEMVAAATRSPARLEAIRKLRLSSIMVLPIRAHGRVLGALTLAYAESGRVYSKADFDFFNDFCGHVGVLLDNARLYEEVSRRDKAKDIFLASLSHELRNPLAPIKSSLELLKMKDTTSDVREELDIIEHQFDHLAKLLNDLLDVTRFTQDTIRIDVRPLGLRRLVARALKSSDTLLKTADVALHVRYADSSIPVMADDTRLEQAITNLISNAVKFTPSGGSIWVSVDKDDTHAIVSIRDSGAGIAKEDLPNIFEMYYQGRTRKNINSGLGIGLLLVRRIVELHGGSVEARSEGEGTGSEFTLRLPLSSEPAPAPLSATVRDTRIAGKRVLIVDDNQPAADSLARLLEKMGATSSAVYSAHDVLAREDLSEYDLLLVDLGMPHMDGIELITALQARGVRVPAAALTGYGMQEDRERTRAAGFMTHLTKPIGLAELRETFDSIFAPSRGRA